MGCLLIVGHVSDRKEGCNMQETRVRISVIMSVYNTSKEDILENSINSILNQTFKDFEFIICDDGSTDSTYQLIESFAAKDNRIILLKNSTNMGLAASLNKCIRNANGKYIARMDADDISSNNRLQRQFLFLENNPEYALVGSWARLLNEKGIWGYRKLKQSPTKKDFLWGSPFIHPSIMVRASVYNKLGGYRVTKETLRLEDFDLFMRMYAKGYKGYNLSEFLLDFREDSMSIKRKKYKYRLDEVKIRYMNYKSLDLIPKGLFFCLKPLIVGLLPIRLIRILRQEEADE